MDPNKEIREVYAEKAETEVPETSEEELKALAVAYAKYLAGNNIKPGDATFVEPEELLSEESGGDQESSDDQDLEEKKTDNNKNRKKEYRNSELFERIEPDEETINKILADLEKSERSGKVAAAIDACDRLQERIALAAARTGEDIVRAGHNIAVSYRQSRRVIGLVLLAVGVLAAVILAVFDRFTVYEYAYNGKTLGYVKNQEDVTDVLDIAGTMMTANSSGSNDIVFTANQNVTFNVVDARGKSTDNSDIAVNKLVYMTDIETEAYGVYDGDNLVAVVKSNEDAERLLNQTMLILSRPDDGMELVDAKFTNDLAIRPVNVLLTSVQTYQEALKNMTQGGSAIICHIVEADENLGSIARTFGVDPVSIYDESNKNQATNIEKGDKICIRKNIDPVSVKMVETGRMKEVIEFETIKKESDEYYEGDTHLEQEGVDGIQIFEGTITKIAGEVTKRDEDNLEIIREKKDKIILIGTAERPKTAPTGTYLVPLNNYVVTSNFGWRWGRLHSGVDMGAAGGTPIMATDGGTVIRASWYSGYGNCVDIDHGNGRVTRYGHCSRILVSAGEEVYQGQVIALVGNTGHSFGNHLHFEIIFNGTPVNPRPYLGI